MKMIHRACTIIWVLALAAILFCDISMAALMSLGVVTLLGLAGALLLKDDCLYSDVKPVARKVAEVVHDDPSIAKLALPAATALSES